MATPTALNPTSSEGRGVAAHPTIQFLTGTAERAFEDESAGQQVEGIDRRTCGARRKDALPFHQPSAPKPVPSAEAQSRQVMATAAFKSPRQANAGHAGAGRALVGGGSVAAGGTPPTTAPSGGSPSCSAPSEA